MYHHGSTLHPLKPPFVQLAARTLQVTVENKGTEPAPLEAGEYANTSVEVGQKVPATA